MNFDLIACEHAEYDEYFEVCEDCGMTGEEIHETECVPKGFGMEEADGARECGRCGLVALNNSDGGTAEYAKKNKE